MTKDASAPQTGLSSSIEPVPVSTADAASIPCAGEAAEAWATFRRLMCNDPEYAWTWHYNLAVPIMDAAGVSHRVANQTAAYLMSALFECDVTTHPHFQYSKGAAQRYHEMRLQADRDEDALLTSVDRSPEGEDPQGLRAQHESAVTAQPADAQGPSS